MTQHIISSISWWLQDHFWLIWLTVTASTAGLMSVYLGRTTSSGKSASKEEKPLSAWRWLNKSEVLAISAFLGFLVGYIVILLYREDFVYYDYSILLETTLSDLTKKPIILPSQGRFYPLAFQEFNVLSLLTNTASCYQLYSILQLVALSAILFLMMRPCNLSIRLALISLVLITPSFLVAFGGLIYPERNVVFWLLAFLISYREYARSPTWRWAIGSILTVQVLMYYKETAFIFVCGISAPALLISAYVASTRRIDLNKLRNPKSALDVMLLALALNFPVYYIVTMLQSGLSHRYIDNVKLPLPEIIALYLKSDLLLPTLIVAVIGRATFLIRTRQCPDPFWDGCAFAALLYMLAYFVLRLFSSYYMAPVDMITVLYISHWLVPAWPRLSRLQKLTLSGIAAVVLVQILAFSNMKLVERKNLISAQVDIANFLISEYARNGNQSLHLFFPFSGIYSRQEFASYLRYRGLEPEREIQSEKQPFNVIISSPVDPRDDRRCLPWLNYVCRQQDEPRSGDLVLILPDDGASFEQLRNLVGDIKPALLFQPIPRSPGFFVVLARLVRPLQPNLPFTNTVNISDAWLHAFVYRWP